MEPMTANRRKKQVKRQAAYEAAGKRIYLEWWEGRIPTPWEELSVESRARITTIAAEAIQAYRVVMLSRGDIEHQD